MKTIFSLILLFSFLAQAAAPPRQPDLVINNALSVGKGTAADSKAVVDMVSTTKGLLSPRMTTAQRDAIASPPTGLEVYNTTTNKKNIYNGTSWVEVGTGAGGEKNAITNGAFNDDASGVAGYADAAGVVPVDGTAGSPTLTCTRSTGSPILEGAGQLLITKDAANRQGEGCSIAFSIDPGEKGHTQVIRFLYSPASGTYSGGSSSTDSDIKVFIYDVTNSVLIYPSANKIMGSVNDGTYKSELMEWQAPSNSTSFRLIFHAATTSASAFTLKLDEIKVGPMNTAQGPPVSDWTSFTSTSGLTGGTTTAPGMWRRVGDSMEVQISYVATSVFTGGVATFTLPSGYTIDTAKFGATPDANISVLGSAALYDVGTDAFRGDVTYSSTTAVNVRYNSEGARTAVGPSTISTTNPFTWANGDKITAQFSVPIVGWSSGQVSSAQYSGRKIIAKYQSTSTATNPTIIDYDTKIEDTVSMCTTGGSWKCTVPEPGSYKITACLQITPSGGNLVAGDYLGLSTYVSGSVKQTSFKRVTATTGVSDQICINDIQILSAGQYIDARWTGSTSVANADISGGVTANYITIERLAIPEQILASDSIYLTVGKTSGSHTSTGNEQTVASWDTPTLDSHGAFVASTGIWTNPSPGIFAAEFEIGFSANATGSRYCGLAKNGTTIGKSSNESLGSASVNSYLLAADQLRLVAGDTLRIVCYQNSGGNLTYAGSATTSRLIIRKIGN